MSPKSCLLSLLSFFLLGSSLAAFADLPDTIPVILLKAAGPVREVRLEGPITILVPNRQALPAGSYALKAIDHRIHLSSQGTGHPFHLETGRMTFQGNPATGLKLVLPSGKSRRYAGTVQISATPDNTLSFLNRVPARDYVKSVVGSETGSGWPLEALKAQAVLTRTRLQRPGILDNLDDTTRGEAYLGLGHVRPETERAVDAVWGDTLTYERHPVKVYYHSACGGHTSTEGLFQGKPEASPPYLASVPCPYCKKSPFWKSTETVIPKASFEKAFGPDAPKILKTDTAQRPTQVVMADGKTLSGYKFWLKLGQAMGWDKAPGTRYNLTRQPDGSVKISSTGAGHGIGLCQWGAAGLAKQGKEYREILRYYFPGSQVISQIK